MKNLITIPLALLGLVFVLSAFQTRTQYQQICSLTAEQKEILSHISIEYLDDGFGNRCKTIRFKGVNVQVVNGLGATNGHLSAPGDLQAFTTNCVGNLIVGYNELGNLYASDDRTGSHNIVTGSRNNYSGYGGIVGGRDSTISGYLNSVVTGVGGNASGGYSLVGSGLRGVASGQMSSVLGGHSNTASGTASTVSGGQNNSATDQMASVSGGAHNVASGILSSVSGGLFRSATGFHDWIAGSLFEDN